MTGTPTLRIAPRQTVAGIAATMSMAWASDADTGQPRYIMELGRDRHGARSRCVCGHCGLALQAVNAGKADYKIRPHFRHPNGAPRDQCLILAARAAALRQLVEQGWLDLPRRRMRGTAIGLSGESYHAWVEAPGERVRVTQAFYNDRARARLVLDDGREVVVDLLGSSAGPSFTGNTAEGEPPTITLGVDDPGLAALPPVELLARLRLLPDPWCWSSHWADGFLRSNAEQQAAVLAHEALDAVPIELGIPDDLPPGLKRETVLHYAVKEILAGAQRLLVPGLRQAVEVTDAAGRMHTADDEWPAQYMTVEDVVLEVRQGRLVPDIRCNAIPEDGGAEMRPLLVEVTVTNTIDEERLARIRGEGHYTLEIDLSITGGRISREQLRWLVLDELACKRWLHHPEFQGRLEELRRWLLKQAEHKQAREARAAIARDRALARPAIEVAADYLEAVRAFLTTRGDLGGPEAMALAERVAEYAEQLRMHGYEDAAEPRLTRWHGVLDRILSIQADRGLGYELPSGFAVLNAIRQTFSDGLELVPVYLIAAKVYPPRMRESQKAWLEAWAEQVRQSIRDGKQVYLRNPRYDRLLSLLFPEMAPLLAKPFGKRTNVSTGDARAVQNAQVYTEGQPRADVYEGVLVDTTDGDWWLKGRDLESWVRSNPSWAKVWFPRGTKKDE